MRLFLAADIFRRKAVAKPPMWSHLRTIDEAGVDVRIVSLNPQSDKAAVSCIMYHVSWSNKLLRYLEYFWLLFREAKMLTSSTPWGSECRTPALIAARLREKVCGESGRGIMRGNNIVRK